MQSISKTRVSRATARLIVQHHLGTGRRIMEFEELKDGYFNASWKIVLDDGFTCVLKVAPGKNVPVMTYERDIMSAEVAAMRMASERTEMPVPDIYAYDEQGAIMGNEHYLMAYVPGISLHAAKRENPGGDYRPAEREVGRLLAQLHEITSDGFGYLAPGASRYTSWQTAFPAMVECVLADGEVSSVALPLSYAELRDRLGLAYHSLDDVSTPSLVHWDLWDGNIFLDPARRELTGIIDFERAMWADPLIEQNFIRRGNNADFLAGYGKAMPTSHGERVRRTLYDIHLFLVMIVEHHYRQYPTNELEQWARRDLLTSLAQLEHLTGGTQ